MSNTTLAWQSFKAMPWTRGETLRELIAAMPVVILAKALREAFFARGRNVGR